MDLATAKRVYFNAHCYRTKVLPQPVYNDAHAVTIAFNRVQYGTAQPQDEWLLDAALAHRFGWKPLTGRY